MPVVKRGKLLEKDRLDALARGREATSTDIVLEWADTDAKGLMIRARGRSVSWYYRAEGTMRKLGDASGLTLADARSLAVELRGTGRQVVRARAAVNGWTLREVFERYADRFLNARRKAGRTRHAKPQTTRDARGVLFKPCLDRYLKTRLPDVDAALLVKMRDLVVEHHSAVQARKFVVYARSALGLVMNEGVEESGIGGLPYWKAVEEPEIVLPEDHDEEAVAPLDAVEVGYILARHEAYCVSLEGKNPNHRVSAAVRYGFFFVALAAQRTFAVLHLERRHLEEDHLHVGDGYALARWRARVMKGSREHALPLAPLLVEVCKRSMAGTDDDRGDDPSRWVFPSPNRLRRRTLVAEDMPLSESALRNHLGNLRGKRKGKDADWLAGVRHFGLHDFRHGLTTHIGSDKQLPKVAASAVLAQQHVPPPVRHVVRLRALACGAPQDLCRLWNPPCKTLCLGWHPPLMAKNSTPSTAPGTVRRLYNLSELASLLGRDYKTIIALTKRPGFPVSGEGGKGVARMSQAESRLDETNRRMDRMSEPLLDAINKLREQVTGVDKRIEVVGSKLDDIAERERGGPSVGPR